MSRATYLTVKGLALLTKTMAGRTALKFSRVMMGDGQLNEGQDIKSLTDLISPKLNLPIVETTIPGNGLVEIETLLQNVNLVQGFFAREIGIYAIDPDEGEILYSVRNTGNDSEYVPAGGVGEDISIFYCVVTVIDQIETVTAVINENLTFISRVDFNEHKEDINPHPNLLQVGKEVDSFAYLNCDFDGSNKKLNWISLDNARKAILGGEASTIPIMQSRINQLEIEQANIALQQEAENMMPDCNMLLAENFVEPDTIDRLEVHVTSCAAGDDSIDVESNYGFVLGSWYWITDGVHAEYVQIKSVIRNGSINRIILTKALVETYAIAQTKIYRTTAWISQTGIVHGSGDVLGVTYKPKVIWSGTSEGSVSDVTIPLDTSLSNADNFIVDGVIFTSDNLVSL